MYIIINTMGFSKGKPLISIYRASYSVTDSYLVVKKFDIKDAIMRMQKDVSNINIETDAPTIPNIRV